MRCLSCKYELKNLPENRCPECGREFDPKNPRTFDNPQLAAPTGWKLLLACTGIGYVVTFGLCWLVFGGILQDVFKDSPLTARILVIAFVSLLLCPFAGIFVLSIYHDHRKTRI